MQTARLTGKHKTRNGFDVQTTTDMLPRIPGDVAARLLCETPFKSALGAVWSYDKNGQPCHAPMASENSIVPVGYDGAFLGTETTSCARCHESTLKAARHFDAPRGWYGTVRGSDDGIFTFHPVTPQSISYNGGRQRYEIRPEFIKAGMIERFDASRHSSEVYHRIRK